MLQGKHFHGPCFMLVLLLILSCILLPSGGTIYADESAAGGIDENEPPLIDKPSSEEPPLIDEPSSEEPPLINEPSSEEPLKTDTSGLENAILNASGEKSEDYLPNTFTVFQSALNEARKVLENPDATQEEIDNAVINLENAAKNLVPKPDKRNLKTTIDKAGALDGSLYTSSTYEAVTNALTKAKKTYDNENATQDAVNTANARLEKAISALKWKALPYRIDHSTNTYYYRVTDLGFDADGHDRKDDTSALQRALDKAGEDHYTVISVPAGTYYISRTLCIQSNTTLKLASSAVIKRMDSAVGKDTLLKNTDEYHDCTGSSKRYNGYSLTHDIAITGGVWDGGNISKTKKSTDLLYFGHAKNVTISGTTIRNCRGAHALEFAGVKNIVVKKCKFYGFLYGKDHYTSEAIQLDICYKSGSTKWAPSYKTDKTTCKNVLIEDNTITDYPRGIGTHHVLKGHPYENITIRNNTITRSSAGKQKYCVSGIFLMGAKKVTIKGNTINRYNYGIWLKQSSKLSIKNNKLKYNPTSNITYDGCDRPNNNIRFTVTKDDIDTTELVYTCPTIQSGYVKTRGKTYYFNQSAESHTATLEQAIEKNQEITFRGKDKNNNQFYRTYHVPPTRK